MSGCRWGGSGPNRSREQDLGGADSQRGARITGGGDHILARAGSISLDMRWVGFLREMRCGGRNVSMNLLMSVAAPLDSPTATTGTPS